MPMGFSADYSTAKNQTLASMTNQSRGGAIKKVKYWACLLWVFGLVVWPLDLVLLLLTFAVAYVKWNKKGLPKVLTIFAYAFGFAVAVTSPRKKLGVPQSDRPASPSSPIELY